MDKYAIDVLMEVFNMALYQERNMTICQTLNYYKVNSIIDCGCGNGRLLKLLAEANSFVKLVGIDNSTKRIAMAKKNNKCNGVELVCGSFFDMYHKFKNFEALVASEIIEHFDTDELRRFTHIVFDYLKPQLVVFTTPNRSYNCNYENLYNGFRHTSHKFEFDELEARQFASDIKSKYPQYIFNWVFCDHHHSSHLIIFRR